MRALGCPWRGVPDLRTGDTTISVVPSGPLNSTAFAGDSFKSGGRDRSRPFPDFASILRALRPTSALIGLFVAGASMPATGECKGMRTWRPRTDRAPGDDHVEEAEPPPLALSSRHGQDAEGGLVTFSRAETQGIAPLRDPVSLREISDGSVARVSASRCRSARAAAVGRRAGIRPECRAGSAGSEGARS